MRPVEIEDIGKAIKSLGVLSKDIRVVETGSKRMIVSSSAEFNSDQVKILEISEKNGGWITFSELKGRVSTFDNYERF